MFTVKVDDVSYWVIENRATSMFKDNTVFGGDNHYNPAADNHYNPAAGKIRNLKVQTKVTYLTTNIKPIFHPISGRISL